MRKEEKSALPIANPELLGPFVDIKDLRSKTKKWLKNTFSTTCLFNAETGWNIQMNTTTIDKLTSGKVGITKMYALTALAEIVRIGICKEMSTDRKERKEIRAVYTFESHVLVLGKKYKYWFIVRVLHNGKFLYAGNLNYET